MAHNIEDHRILSPRLVAEKTSLSRTTLWRMTRAQVFPQPIKLSKARIGWRETDVLDWIAARAPSAHMEAA